MLFINKELHTCVTCFLSITLGLFILGKSFLHKFYCPWSKLHSNGHNKTQNHNRRLYKMFRYYIFAHLEERGETSTFNIYNNEDSNSCMKRLTQEMFLPKKLDFPLECCWADWCTDFIERIHGKLEDDNIRKCQRISRTNCVCGYFNNMEQNLP